jgi:hypothetical protein
VIDVVGTLHTVNHFVPAEGGGYHVNSHFNLVNVKGVGQTTGANYVIPASGAAVENYIPTSDAIVTGTVDINMVIGKEQLPNQVALARVHYIIDDGTVKVETVRFHFQCQ